MLKSKRQSSTKRRVLVVEYDVTGLTGKQIDRLMNNADAHPGVPVLTTKVVDRARK
jgi:hypothetical protein